MVLISRRKSNEMFHDEYKIIIIVGNTNVGGIHDVEVKYMVVI